MRKLISIIGLIVVVTGVFLLDLTIVNKTGGAAEDKAATIEQNEERSEKAGCMK